MSCNVNPGELQATGHAKKVKRAIAHALVALQQMGDAACSGGNCGPDNCEWVVQSVSFTYHFDTGTNEYEATATGIGECSCV